MLGEVVENKFRIIRRLGSGGMGTVYMAEHVGIGKRVAIKFLRADLRAQEQLVHRLRREAMAVSRLEDIHTITVFDFGVWEGLVYLVMEYLEGDDLAKVLGDDGRLDWVDALSITRQMCQSLAEAHRQGVIHRDLKPDNVFLTRTPSGGYRVKVLDFGIAKLVDHGEGGDSFYQTQDGAMMGTPYFMSPEQFEGTDVDTRTDLYSVGALLYRMLTGSLPYSGKSLRDLMDQHRSGSVPSFDSVCAELDVPDGVESLVRRLMSADKSTRYQSAEDVLADIDQFLSASNGSEGVDADSPALGPIQSRPSASIKNEGALHVESSVESSGQFTMGASLSPSDSAYEGRSTMGGRPTASSDQYARRLRRRRWLVPAAMGAVSVAAVFALWSTMVDRASEPLKTEHEPNDVTESANQLTPGFPIQGYIGRRANPDTSDRDIYLVSVPDSNGWARVSATGIPEMDVVVDVFSYEGKLLARLNDKPSGAGEAGHVDARNTPMLQICIREVWVEGQMPRENSTDAYTLKVEFQREGPRELKQNPT